MGVWKAHPFTVVLSTRLPLFVSVMAYSQFLLSLSPTSRKLVIVRAFVGQFTAHTSHDEQSIADT